MVWSFGILVDESWTIAIALNEAQRQQSPEEKKKRNK